MDYINKSDLNKGKQSYMKTSSCFFIAATLKARGTQLTDKH